MPLSLHLPHTAVRFRSRSVNNAGESLWSYPSSNVQLGSVEDQGNDAEQTELQLTVPKMHIVIWEIVHFRCLAVWIGPGWGVGRVFCIVSYTWGKAGWWLKMGMLINWCSQTIPFVARLNQRIHQAGYVCWWFWELPSVHTRCIQGRALCLVRRQWAWKTPSQHRVRRIFRKVLAHTVAFNGVWKKASLGSIQKTLKHLETKRCQENWIQPELSNSTTANPLRSCSQSRS